MSNTSQVQCSILNNTGLIPLSLTLVSQQYNSRNFKGILPDLHQSWLHVLYIPLLGLLSLSLQAFGIVQICCHGYPGITDSVGQLGIRLHTPYSRSKVKTVCRSPFFKLMPWYSVSNTLYRRCCLLSTLGI